MTNVIIYNGSWNINEYIIVIAIKDILKKIVI